MKIAYVITYFHPFTGGAETNCLEIAKRLAKTNEVHVFTSGRKEEKIEKKEEIIDNIQIHRSKTWFRKGYYFAFYPSLIKKLLKYDFDIIHFHSFGFIQHDLALLLCKLSKKSKLVCTPHGPFMALKKYTLLERLFKFLVNSSEKLFYNKLYDAVIEVNPYQLKWLKKQGINKNKIHLIPNGISESIFKKTDSSDFKKKYNLTGFILGYLGRIQKYKGLEQIIKTLPLLKDVKFLAIGEDAGNKNNLISLAEKLNVKDRVIFTGRLSEEDKIKALDSMSIFIFPSEWEAFGISMLEAMARKKPIISTKTEGAEYLISKENGLLFDYNDTKTLTREILFLKKEKKISSAMSKANKIKSKEFLWEKIAEKVLKLYISLQ